MKNHYPIQPSTIGNVMKFFRLNLYTERLKEAKLNGNEDEIDFVRHELRKIKRETIILLN